MVIGERMSKSVDVESLIEVGGFYKDYYESQVHQAQDRPLTTGQLFYAKLRFAFIDEPDIEIEVYWNHFTNRITGQVKSGRQVEVETSFVEEPMPRQERIIFINHLVNAAMEGLL